MSRTASASGGDSGTAAGRAAGGVEPAHLAAQAAAQLFQRARKRPPTWTSAGSGARLRGFRRTGRCSCRKTRGGCRCFLAPGGRRRDPSSRCHSCRRQVADGCPRSGRRRESPGAPEPCRFPHKGEAQRPEIDEQGVGADVVGAHRLVVEGAGSMAGTLKALRSRTTSPTMCSTPRTRSWRRRAPRCSRANLGRRCPSGRDCRRALPATGSASV